MPKKSDIKKALETILGFQLTEEAVDLIQLTQVLASYTRSDSPGEGFVTKKSFFFDPPRKSCRPARLLDVSGFATTGKDGKSRFRLTDFICLDNVSFEHPINVVATPLSATPCFLTVLHSAVNNQTDIEIQVSTWDANGAAAPIISFNWRCQVEFVEGLL